MGHVYSTGRRYECQSASNNGNGVGSGGTGIGTLGIKNGPGIGPGIGSGATGGPGAANTGAAAPANSITTIRIITPFLNMHYSFVYSPFIILTVVRQAVNSGAARPLVAEMPLAHLLSNVCQVAV